MNSNAYWQGYAEAALQHGVDPQVLQKSAAISPEMYGAGAGALLGGGIGGYFGGGMGALAGGLGGAGLGYGGVAGAKGLGMLGDPRSEAIQASVAHRQAGEQQSRDSQLAEHARVQKAVAGDQLSDADLVRQYEQAHDFMKAWNRARGPEFGGMPAGIPEGLGVLPEGLAGIMGKAELPAAAELRYVHARNRQLGLE